MGDEKDVGRTDGPGGGPGPAPVSTPDEFMDRMRERIIPSAGESDKVLQAGDALCRKVLETIQEVEQDFRMGKQTEEEYNHLSTEYKREYLELKNQNS